MSRKTVYILWGALFALCAGLGFVTEPRGVLRWLLTALSVVFFLPPAYLLVTARRQGDRDTCCLIRNLAALSLALTLLTLIANVMFAVGSQRLGLFLHGVLVVVSSPMICSGYWALSLFLWACILIGAAGAARGENEK